MTKQDTAPLAHTVPDACARLGLSRTTLYELIGSGEIRAFKVGSRTLVSEAELRRFVAEKMKVAA
jgi:excisionase family DNA binding protein